MAQRPGQIDVGSEMQLTGSFTDQDGAALDPDTVAFRTKSPCGTETLYTYETDDEIERSGTGEYVVTFTVGEAGTWIGRWETTGPIFKLREQFNVTMSGFEADGFTGDYSPT